MPTTPEADHERRLSNRALYLTFAGEADKEMGMKALAVLAKICGVDDPAPLSMNDAHTDLAIAEGRRRVYLDVFKCIELGQSQVVEDGWNTLADSEDGEESNEDGWTSTDGGSPAFAITE